MRLYLCGPMSGLPDSNYPAFHAAAAELRAAGYDVRSPAELDTREREWTEWMRITIPQMLDCEGIALLPGWERSRGARIEFILAAEIGLGVLYLDKWRSARSAGAITE